MKKKSLICAIVAMALILVGTGYAYWTDSLNVTTKATTGDLDVTFVDLGYYAQWEADIDSDPSWSIIDGIPANEDADGNYREGFMDARFFAKANANDVGNAQRDKYLSERAAKYNQIGFNAELKDAQGLGVLTGDPNFKIRGGAYNAGTKGSDEIELTLDNLYPGYAQTFRTDIANIGSIAAKLSKIKFDVETNGDAELTDELKNLLGVAVLVEKERYSPEVPSAQIDHVFGLAESLIPSTAASKVFTVGGVDFVRLSEIDEIIKNVTESENATLLALPSGNTADLFLGIAVDPDAAGRFTTGTPDAVLAGNENDDSDSENKGATLNIQFLWDQFNEGVEADATNILEKQNIGANQ